MIPGLERRFHRAWVMFDWLVTLAVQHYVIFGTLAISGGVILNVVITAAPEVMEQLRFRKLY